MSAPIPTWHVELPIPEDVQPGPGWSQIMIAMAGHIGAYDVLRLCDVYGGQVVYFPQDSAKAPFVDVLGEEKAERLRLAFCRERLTLPTARHPLSLARRSGVLASVRCGEITVAEAAAMLRMRQDTVGALLRSGEAQDCAMPRPAIGKSDPRQLDLFPGEQ